ncbi:MAG: DUF4932 domain-containing protein [Cytophagaceae bacterium]|nr:DUF4932 domain-containing protein [Gemmatimonadaceae bacterium]
MAEIPLVALDHAAAEGLAGDPPAMADRHGLAAFRDTCLKRAALLLMLVASSASAQGVRVIDDQRAEIIGILFRIAGAPDFSGGNVQPYTRQVDSTFLPYRNHPVFAEINRLRTAYGIALSDVTTMAPQLTDPVTFGERSPIDAPTSTLARSWHGAEARVFLAQARDFARVANVAGFLRAQQHVYDSATARAQRLIDTKARLDWFTKFFNEPTRDLLIISPLLMSSSGNFAAAFHDGAIHERYAFLAVPGIDTAGYPVLHPETLATLIHELNHSYINHVVDAVSAQLRPAGARIFPIVQAEMSRLAYTRAQVMFNESVVRAAVIRYLLANDGASAGRAESRVQAGLGFFWIDELVELLGEYEANRTQYSTFSTFMPRLVAYFDDLAPRVTEMRTAYENRRPRIIKTSIARGAQDVDPTLRALVLTFDAPVGTSYSFAGNLGDGIPEFTGGSFDGTRTVFTIGIKLEPGRDYHIPFGPGFVNDDGYPNQRLDLRFHTRNAR